MIGIFDSGSGGLTILEACIRRLPGQDFVYLGDHGRAPYGDRANPEIVALSIEMIEALFDQGCNLVVLACNTAAAVALRSVQQDWLAHHHPSRRVLGVLVPTVEVLTGKPWLDVEGHAPGATDARTVALFATSKTVETHAYVEEIAKRDPNIAIAQIKAPTLVPLIEAGVDEHLIDAAVAERVAALAATVALDKIDAVLLGCTHYPLIEAIFRRHLPAATEIVSQPSIVAEALADYLDRHPEFRSGGTGRVRYLTTGSPARADAIAHRMTPLKVKFEGL